MVLWCIQVTYTTCLVDKIVPKSTRTWRIRKYEANHKKEAGKQFSEGFMSRLDENPEMKQTKVGELAKFFLWDPYFPVHLEDETLFHVLQILSKHQLLVLPVIERATDQVIGFITQQNAVVKFLLQSSGQQWFDSIANVSLSEHRFQRKNSAYQVYEDQSVTEALLVLSENRVPAVAVIDRKTKELVGTVRKRDITLLLENSQLFSKSKTTTLAEVIKMSANVDNYNLINQNLQSDPLAQSLRPKSNLIFKMDSPVIHKEANILKQVMEKMTEANSETSFLVDDRNRVMNTLTLKDIIMEFAPPCMDSRINGGGFFESALQQTRCHIENGTMVSDQ
ncbi:SNF1-related protein kinase regulatory subunit gamma-1-like [Bienertia sinuspersici]